MEMERAEKMDDDGRRESPHDEEKPEEPGDGAEVPSDISMSQQVTHQCLFQIHVLMPCPHNHLSSVNTQTL